MSIVLGIDTSHYQGNYDYAAAYKKGARFAGIQLTVGVNDDAYGAKNVKRALDAGLYVLPYHFANANGSGAAQADHFFDRVSKLPSQPRLYPILDIEPKEGATQQTIIAFLADWTSHGDRGRIGVYSGPGAFARCMGSRSCPLASGFPQIKLVWNADYRGPLVTSSDDPRFDLHFVGSIYGYGGFSSAQIVQDGPRFGTDGDAFAGTEADLAALFAGPITKPTVRYRFGAIPAWRGDYVAVSHAPVRSAPGTGAPRVTTYSPGHSFHVSQSLTRANGRRWLGNDDGTLWVLADGRVKKQ